MDKDELLEARSRRSRQELNIGDKVIALAASGKPLFDGKVATIIEKGILGGSVYYGLYIDGVVAQNQDLIGVTSLLSPFYAEDLELVQAKEPENKPDAAPIAALEDAGLSDAYWDDYEARLAHDVLLATINTCHDSRPAYIGKYAALVAKCVVENLKQREECAEK